MDVPRETGSGSDLIAPSTSSSSAESAAELFGVGLTVAQAYAEALATSGVERGLIGPREVPRLWERHLLNCVVLQELIPAGVDLADVGSGAGLPGLPLAIARPDLSVSLIEPLLRRVVWLSEIVPALEITNVEVIRARANAVIENGQRFDVVTARAVLPLPALLTVCMPLLKAGGVLLAMKGDSAEAELLEAEEVLAQLGASDWAVVFCGEGVLETPTKVVRVVAGRHGRAHPVAPPPRASKSVKQSGSVKRSGSVERSGSAKPPRKASPPTAASPVHAEKSAAANRPVKETRAAGSSTLQSTGSSKSPKRSANLARDRDVGQVGE